MKKSVFLLCALMTLFFFGCGDDDDKPAYRLIVSDYSLGFESNGGSQSFEVTSNVDWTVTVDETWCTVSPSIGYENGTVNVNVTANNGALSRWAFVTVSNTEYELSEEIFIYQEGKPQGLDVSLLPGVWKSVTSENEDGTVTQYNANWHIVFTLNSNGTFEWDLDNPSPNLDVLVTGSWTASVVTQSLVLQGTMYVGGTLFGENHDVYFIEELTEETLVILNQVTSSKMTFSKNVWMDNAGYDIYVAGVNKDGYATYWKNGEAFVNQNVKEVYRAIDVSDGDVYTLYGSYESGLSYCKNNGTPVTLTGGNIAAPTSVTDIAVSNGDVYVCGYGGGYLSGLPAGSYVGMYWKNGSAVSRLDASSTNRGIAYSIAVSNGNVYVAGYAIHPGGLGYAATYVAAYWKNGSYVNLGGSNSVARSVFVSGDDVYVAGAQRNSNYQTIFKYWKNGTAVDLYDASPNLLNNDISIAVTKNGEVHVASLHFRTSGGYEYTYWTNGVKTILGTSTYGGIEIATVDNDVYIIGNMFGLSNYWKNGTVESFTNESGAEARDIVVVSR